MHVPILVVVSSPEVIEQSLAVPLLTPHVTMPPVVPPEVVRRSGVPYVPVVLEMLSVAWLARLMVMVWVSDVVSYCASAAFVAVTTQDPAAVGVKVVPVTEQSPDTLANDTDPVPEPPVVIRVRLAAYVAVVLEIVRGAWVARVISKLRATPVAAE